MTAGGPDAVFRLTPAQKLPVPILAVFVLIVTFMSAQVIWVIAAILMILLGLTQITLARTSLEGDTLVAHNGLWKRRYPRSSIKEIQIASVGSNRRILLITEQGRAVALPAPTDGKLGRNKDFDEHAAVLMRWYKQGRR